MSKYVLLDGHTLPNAPYEIESDMLKEKGIDCVIAECKSPEEIVAAAADADAIGLVYAKMDEELLSKLPKCKVLVRYGVGYDSIDVNAASKLGMAVCNLPDYCQPDVATHAFALVLDCCRKVTLLDRDMRRGNWSGNAGYKIHRLSAMKLGLLGFGAIARQFLKYIKPYEMEVLVYDPFAPADFVKEQGATPVSLDELLAQSDVISIHCPLTPDTHHIINKDTIAKMKDGAIIVNTARGPIVCLEDLVEALKSGKILAAGLDTMEGETNLNPSDPIFGFENVVLTPHSAYNSVEAEIEQHQKVAQSVINVLGGDLPYNVVNKKQLNER